MTAFDPHEEPLLRMVVDLEGYPSLHDMADLFLRVQDLFYVGGLLERKDSLPYTVADRLSPEFVELTKLSQSFYVRRLSMESPLLIEVMSYATGGFGMMWSVLRLWDKFEDIRLKHSQNQLQMEINKQLQQELQDVNHYYKGFEQRFQAKQLEIRDPVLAEQNAASLLSQAEQVELKGP